MQESRHPHPIYMAAPSPPLGVNNYHECNKTALPSLGAAQVHVSMHHTKPGMLQQNLLLVSSALTCDIPFQTAGDDIHLFPREPLTGNDTK